MSNIWQIVAQSGRRFWSHVSLGPFEPEVSSAVGDWVGGLLIGVTPLIAHAILHLLVRPVGHWTEIWVGEILFFTITNSGLSLVTLIARLRRGSVVLPGSCTTFGGLILINFLVAVLIYGAVASGSARGIAFTAAIFEALASAVLSLYFELTLALNTSRSV